MSHDATKIPMGTTKSSDRTVDNRRGEAATFKAGLQVRLKSDETLSLVSTDGLPLGVSLGRDMSGIGRTAICRRGLGVPVRLAASFVPVIGAQVHFSNTTGEAMASGAGATGSNATYISGALTLVEEDGTEVAARVAYVDMPGGL